MERCLRLFLMLLPLAVCSAAAASEYHGQVFFAGAPVPGAEVTVTQGQKRQAAVTDRQGLYEFADLGDGVWKIHIEMRGFLALDAEVKVAAETPQGAWELKLLGLDRLLAEAKPGKVESKPLPPPASAPAPTLSAEAAKQVAGKTPAQKGDEPKPGEAPAPPPQTPPDEKPPTVCSSTAARTTRPPRSFLSRRPSAIIVPDRRVSTTAVSAPL
jgi:hypothetical protein